MFIVQSWSRVSKKVLIADCGGGGAEFYMDERDFNARELSRDSMWRTYDHDDEAAPTNGPVWYYFNDDQAREAERLFNER
jgi:hypothetical protein